MANLIYLRSNQDANSQAYSFTTFLETPLRLKPNSKISLKTAVLNLIASYNVSADNGTFYIRPGASAGNYAVIIPPGQYSQNELENTSTQVLQETVQKINTDFNQEIFSVNNCLVHYTNGAWEILLVKGFASARRIIISIPSTGLGDLLGFQKIDTNNQWSFTSTTYRIISTTAINTLGIDVVKIYIKNLPIQSYDDAFGVSPLLSIIPLNERIDLNTPRVVHEPPVRDYIMLNNPNEIFISNLIVELKNYRNEFFTNLTSADLVLVVE